MARILTGIQSTGSPHLGNILGAMRPAINLANNPIHEVFCFIADLHTLTSVKDPSEQRNYVYDIAAAWLACGLDTQQGILYRQSQVPSVCELAWYLNCFTPYPMLANAHAFKKKANHLADVNAGLFIYPVLMAADILLYEADMIPIGKDQHQHIEITRDLATRFNHRYGATFTLPQAHETPDTQLIPGIDGQKMSKSYRNTINPFLPEKDLRKIIMAIKTDSTPLEQPKVPDQCIIFRLYSMLAHEAQIAALRNKYLAGGYGYGQAKKELLTLILEQFSMERQRFQAYREDIPTIEQQLAVGEEKARDIAARMLHKVRTKLGFA